MSAVSLGADEERLADLTSAVCRVCDITHSSFVDFRLKPLVFATLSPWSIDEARESSIKYHSGFEEHPLSNPTQQCLLDYDLEWILTTRREDLH
jgi:hypothetical protein